MNPKKISLFLTLVLLVLGALTFLSGVQTTKENHYEEGFNIAGWVVKYPTFASVTSFKSVKNNDKALEIMQEAEALVKKDTDSITLVKKDSIFIDKDDDKETVEENFTQENIYYPKDRKEYLTRWLAKLGKSKCRIVHYGDSQIEVDRITAYIRNKLQKEYGGSGPGFFPLKIVYDQKSIKVNASPNWRRYAAFDKKQNRLLHGAYGLYTTFSRFTPYNDRPLDSINLESLPIETSYITIEPSKIYYPRLQDYKKMGIHYGNSKVPVTITAYDGEALILRDTLRTDGKYHNYKIDFEETPQDLRIAFEGKISPDFYGITLDDEKGVSMDNVPMRGESGRFFVHLDKDLFQQMSDELKPDIFIFQYGGNTIPYTFNEKQVKGYVRSLMNSIKWVQRRNPKALFLVVGPGDMATSINGEMLTYPMLPVLDKEMREKSTENGFAYWSLFEAMGGENAMATWVAKGNASSDYVHFSPKGAELMGELFYKNLQKDLQLVKKK